MPWNQILANRGPALTLTIEANQTWWSSSSTSPSSWNFLKVFFLEANIEEKHISPKTEPALELHSRAAPSMEAHHHVNGPNIGRNS